MVPKFRLTGWLVSLIWLLCLTPVRAAPVVEVIGPTAGESQELVKLLQDALKEDVQVQAAETLLPQADLLVALSEDIYRRLPEKHPPVILLSPGLVTQDIPRPDSAVYWAPSLSAQLALIRFLLPATNRVGMLVNTPDDPVWKAFRQYAAQQSVEIRILPADRQRLARQVAELAAGCDVLLAQPDADIYNRDNIRLLLLSAYRQNRVFVGPSPAFVRAGALGTLYAPTPVIAEAIIQRIRSFTKNGKLPPSSRIRDLSVSLNPQVSRALGLSVPAINELERLLHFEELPTWP